MFTFRVSLGPGAQRSHSNLHVVLPGSLEIRFWRRAWECGPGVINNRNTLSNVECTHRLWKVSVSVGASWRLWDPGFQTNIYFCSKLIFFIENRRGLLEKPRSNSLLFICALGSDLAAREWQGGTSWFHERYKGEPCSSILIVFPGGKTENK